MTHPHAVTLDAKFLEFVSGLPPEEQAQLVKRNLGANCDGNGLSFCFHVPRIALVNREADDNEAKSKFHDAVVASLKSSEWSKEDLEKFFAILNSGDLDFYDLTSITAIDFSNFHAVNTHAQQNFSKEKCLMACPNIEKLAFGSQAALSLTGISYIVANSVKLASLSLAGSKLKADEVNQILKASPATLTSLDLSQCEVNAETMTLLSDKFKSLTGLNLAHVEFTDDITDKAEGEMIADLLIILKQLTHINLNGLSFIEDSHLTLLATFGEQLKELHISGVDISNQGVTVFLRSCTEITKLSLASCADLDDTILSAIALKLKDLHYLNVRATNITAGGLAEFIGDHSGLKGAEIITDCRKSDVLTAACEAKTITLNIPAAPAGAGAVPTVVWMPPPSAGDGAGFASLFG